MQAGFQTFDVVFQRIGRGFVHAGDPESCGVRARTIGAEKDDVADGEMGVSQKLPRDQDGRRLRVSRRSRCERRGRQHEQYRQETATTEFPGAHDLIMADSRSIQATPFESVEAG